MTRYRISTSISDACDAGHACLSLVRQRCAATERTCPHTHRRDPFLSIASVWEIAIKVGLGKLTPHVPFPMLIAEQLNENGIALLDITVDHALRVAQLPYHHRDPFDRMLIAQAITEGLPIISADSVFDAYPVTRVW